MSLIWGASFLFMKVALDGVSFGQVAWSREILGALTLGVIMLIGRHKLPKEPVVWFHFFIIGATNCAIPHLLFAWAEQTVSTSLAAIYNSTTPLATALLAAVVFRVEHLAKGQVLGIVIGVLGVLVIIAPWQEAALRGDLAGQLACVAAAVSYGVALSYMRRYISRRPIDGTTVAFMTVGFSAAIMVALTPVLALDPVNLSWQVVGSLILLGALGTGLAYIWNIGVLRAWGPTNVSTVTYVIPVVAVALGIMVLGETLSWNEPAGAVLILIGILFAQERIHWGRRRGTPSPRSGQDAAHPVKQPSADEPERSRTLRAR
jgi:drug/metabolite transporter (DMT)-like permease